MDEQAGELQMSPVYPHNDTEDSVLALTCLIGEECTDYFIYEGDQEWWELRLLFRSN